MFQSGLIGKVPGGLRETRSMLAKINMMDGLRKGVDGAVRRQKVSLC